MSHLSGAPFGVEHIQPDQGPLADTPDLNDIGPCLQELPAAGGAEVIAGAGGVSLNCAAIADTAGETAAGATDPCDSSLPVVIMFSAFIAISASPASSSRTSAA